MVATTSLALEPLTSTTGARVIELDPRAATDAEIGEIRDALTNHGVLVFTAPGMTVDEQVVFTNRFGSPHGHPVSEFLTGTDNHPVSVVENNADKPPQDDQNFHTDYSFNTVIPDLAVLRAEVIPLRGGDTMWSSAEAAYAGLSDLMKGFIANLVAVHDAGERFWFEMDRTLGPDAAAKARRAFPGATHPVVVAHPYSSRPLLFVNPGYTTRIVGLRPRESRALLDLLFDQLNDPAFHYRHRWQPGDVVMWDEHATVHMGPNDFHPAHRRLTRVTAGRRPPTALLDATPHVS
jgi:taurine dioxygenase